MISMNKIVEKSTCYLFTKCRYNMTRGNKNIIYFDRKSLHHDVLFYEATFSDINSFTAISSDPFRTFDFQLSPSYHPVIISLSIQRPPIFRCRFCGTFSAGVGESSLAKSWRCASCLFLYVRQKDGGA